jgi:hypothetical protein
LQSSIEEEIFEKQAAMEAQAIVLLQTSSDSSDSSDSKAQAPSAATLIADFQEETATRVRERWWSFFWAMVSKYRDMMM